MPWLQRMLAVDAAEAAGDPAQALDLVESMPCGPDGRPWWRPQRVRRLRQLVAPATRAAIEPLLLASDVSAVSRLADALGPPADVLCGQIRDQLSGAA